MNQFVIYALHHDSSNSVYVGKTGHGMKRPNGHGSPYNLRVNARLPVVCWIKKLIANNFKYEISIIEECDSFDSLGKAEIFYIAYFRSIGMRLLNQTGGGDGATMFSDEHRAKISRAHMGRKASLETRARIAAGATNPSEETRRKRSIAMMKYVTPEYGERMAAMNRGRKATDEQRQKQSDSHKGKKLTAEHAAAIKAALNKPEIKLKMIAFQRSRPPRSAETRAKLAIAGRNQSAEKRAKISFASRNMSAETRAKIGAKAKGRKHSVEVRARMSEACRHRDPAQYAKSAQTKKNKRLPRIRINLLGGSS